MMRRAKLVLNRTEVCQALDLRGLTVVGLYVTHGPDQLHVEVEGPAVPVFSGQVDAGDEATLAWAGLVDAPVLPWPQPAGPRSAGPRLSPQTVVEAADRVRVNVCRVDETVGGDDLEADATKTPPAMTRLWDAAADAAREGVPPLTVVAAVQDAIRTAGALRQEDLRREVLETTERTVDLLRQFLGEAKEAA